MSERVGGILTTEVIHLHKYSLFSPGLYYRVRLRNINDFVQFYTNFVSHFRLSWMSYTSNAHCFLSMEYCCVRAAHWRPSVLSDSPNSSCFKHAWTSYTFNKLQSARHNPQNQNEPLAVLEMVQGGCVSPLCHFKRTVPELLWQPALSPTPSQGPANNPSSQRTPPSPPGLTYTLFRKETSRAATSSVCANIQRNRDLVSASFIITGASEFKWDSPPAWQAGTFPDSSLEEKCNSPAIYFDYLSICGLTYLWWGLHGENTSQITGIIQISP